MRVYKLKRRDYNSRLFNAVPLPIERNDKGSQTNTSPFQSNTTRKLRLSAAVFPL